MAAAGVPMRTLQEWMGHRDLATTMRYVHHQPRQEAAERLGRHFTGAASELDALLGEAWRLPDRAARLSPPWDDSGRPNRPRNARVRGSSGVFRTLRVGHLTSKEPVLLAFLMPEEGLEPPTRGL